MNCTEFEQSLYAYMEAKLATAGREALERHRDACEPCAGLFRLAFETSCREVAEFLDDYVEGHLDAERRAVFERHLAICSDCVSYLDGYRRTMGLAQDAAAAPDAIPADLVARILAARRRPGG